MWGSEPGKHWGCWTRWAETPDDWSELKGRSDEIAESINHHGWYLDDCFDGVAFGIVRKVRTKMGLRYIAAVTDTCNGDKYGNGPCAVEVHEDGSPLWYDCEPEAARFANTIAERYAEKEREYQEGWRARNDAEEKADEARKEIAGLRTKARSLVAGIRQSTLAPSLCTHLREELQRIREESAEAWEALRESMKTMERLKEFA